MVNISNHGGSCCGARHIYGFGAVDALNNIAQMHNLVASAPDRLTEIILNRSQCRASPNLLAAMAARGFVLTTGFKNGNHDSDVFVFHRSDRRLRLDNTERDFGFVWTGQLAQPTLHGNLDALVATNAPAPQDTLQEQYRRVGARINMQFLPRYPDDMLLQYSGPSQVRQGHIFGLRDGDANWQSARSYPYNGSRCLRVRNVTTGEEAELAITSFQIHRFTAAAPQPALPRPPLGNQTYATAANEQPRAEAERVVYTTHHNVYRDGRIGAGYPTTEEARDAAPRAAQRLTRNIYNTGRVEDVRN